MAITKQEAAQRIRSVSAGIRQGTTKDRLLDIADELEKEDEAPILDLRNRNFTKVER